MVEEDGNERSNVLVTYGTGSNASDTCIFALDGKLSFVAVTEKDVASARSHNRPTCNDQYNVTVEVSRVASDSLIG